MFDIDLDYKTVIAAALVGAVAIWTAKKAVTAGAKEVAEVAQVHLDPTKESNIFNRAFGSLYQGLTGSEQALGADIYDLTHPKEGAPEATLYQGDAVKPERVAATPEYESLDAYYAGPGWELHTDEFYELVDFDF